MLGFIVSRGAALLEFWFGTQSQGLAKPETRQRWFSGDPEFDAECRAFTGELELAATGLQGALSEWLTNPRGTLAYIVLCDQIPRNVYRSSAKAFAWDSLALAAAKAAVSSGYDRELTPDERGFVYMPFEHSEDVLDQHTSVGLFACLRDSVRAPDNARQAMGDKLRWAHQHRDIILEFGRFPHRNAVLGRPSTKQELEYLENGTSFGQ